MPVSKKKRTTSETALSKAEPSTQPLPEQQEFQRHLRALAQSAVRTVVELVMREELDAFIGAAWGASSPKRKGYHNGTYSRDLVTSTGLAPGDQSAQTDRDHPAGNPSLEPHPAEVREHDDPEGRQPDEGTCIRAEQKAR